MIFLTVFIVVILIIFLICFLNIILIIILPVMLSFIANLSSIVQQYKDDGFFILCGKRASCRKQKHLVAQLSGSPLRAGPGLY
jgi:hypothetical protein